MPKGVYERKPRIEGSSMNTSQDVRATSPEFQVSTEDFEKESPKEKDVTKAFKMPEPEAFFGHGSTPDETVIDFMGATSMDGDGLPDKVLESSAGFYEFQGGGTYEQARQAYEKFMEDGIVIEISPARDKNDFRTAYVAVNGHALNLPRGKQIRIARKFVERLAQSREIHPYTAD